MSGSSGSQVKMVTLSTPLSVIKGIAVRRQQYIRSTDVNNHKRSPDTDLKVEIDGLIGEFAVQQYFGVRSTPVNLGNRPDGGIDLVIDGHTVDVKFSQYLSGDLCFKSKKAFKAKRAILAVPVTSDYLEHEYPVVRLAGWVRREEFLSRCLVHREPSELEQQRKTWHGVGMTQPAGMMKNCMECSYHYSPIHQVTT